MRCSALIEDVSFENFLADDTNGFPTLLKQHRVYPENSLSKKKPPGTGTEIIPESGGQCQ
jgi:hypothetical protein